MSFVRFMSSTAGRVARAAIGVVLIVLAFVLAGGWLWLLAPGVFFVAVGALDVCVFAPLFGMPLSGKKVRAAL
jgi:hypothetical protein